jgi:serine/threonine protein kinase
MNWCHEVECNYVCVAHKFYRCHCLVFPLRFPHHIRHIGEQLLTTCAGLHQIGVVHADIKPENILFVDASYTTVQIQNITVNVPLCTDIRMVSKAAA